MAVLLCCLVALCQTTLQQPCLSAPDVVHRRAHFGPHTTTPFVTLVLSPATHSHTQELTADKSRLDEVNCEAARLRTEGHSGEHIIQEHQASLNTRLVSIIIHTRLHMESQCDYSAHVVYNTSKVHDNSIEVKSAVICPGLVV